MSEKTAVTGNYRILHYLSQAAARGRLSHAYLISGEKGMGKKRLAAFLAQALLCNSMGQNENAGQLSFISPSQPDHVRMLEDGPCGHCPACTKSLSGNHPDIIWVGHEKANVITVGEIRKYVLDDIDIKPFYGSYKIYIIPDAHLMNENAQNALLKTIEEPPEYGLILMLTENDQEMLPTIRSRCITLQMERLSTEAITEMLKEQLQADDASAKEAAAFAAGNPGRALEAAGEDSRRLIEWLIDILLRLAQMNADEIYKAAKELEKEDRRDIFEIVNKWLRDVLVFRDENDRNLYFPAAANATKKLAEKMSFEDINSCITYVAEAEEQIFANVKAEAVYENMMLRLRRKMR